MARSSLSRLHAATAPVGLRGNILKKLISDGRAMRPLTASLASSTVLRAAGAFASFLLGIQLARYLQPEGFGLYGVAIAAAQILGVMAQAGVPTLALREISVGLQNRDWPLMSGILRWAPRVIVAASAIVSGIFLVGLWLYPAVTGDSLPPELWYVAALVPLFAITVLLNAELRALGRVVAGQSLEILVRPALVCVFVFLVYFTQKAFSPRQALLVQIAASIVTLALGLYWRRSEMPSEARETPPVHHGRSWTRAAIPLGVSDLLLQLTGTYGIFVVGLLSPPVEAGYLRVAWSTIVIIATPLSIFNVVLAPRLAQLNAAGNVRDLQRMLAYAAAAMSVVTCGVLLVLYAIGQPLLEILFGAVYAKSWAPLMLLTLGQTVIAFFGVGWVLLSVSGGERKLALSFAISTVAGIVVAVLLAPRYGAVGTAWATLFGNVIHSLLCWYFVRKHSGVDSSVFGLIAARSAAA